jgi:hypothetical protein
MNKKIKSFIGYYFLIFRLDLYVDKYIIYFLIIRLLSFKITIDKNYKEEK